MGRVIVVGSLNMDLFVRFQHLPQEGETLIGDSFERFPGGKGANQAVAAARLGAPVSMIGAVGDDLFGGELIDSLAHHGVDTRGVIRLTYAPTGVACILLDTAGQNRIIVVPGANHLLEQQSTGKFMADIHARDVLLVQMEIPIPTVRQALASAAQVGATTVFNPAPAQTLDSTVLRHVQVLTPNEIEAAQLTKCPVTSIDDAKKAAGILLKMGVQSVVMTLGSRGALVANEPDPRKMTLVEGHVVQAVDTVGAGDAFNGALAAKLAQGTPLSEAVRFANAAAAISVTRPGAQPAMPSLQDVYHHRFGPAFK